MTESTDHRQLSDAYYKEAREQYIGDANNTLTITTWLIGFLLLWVQLTIEKITNTQQWLVVAALLALFLSIFLSFWTRRKINEFLNDAGKYFEEQADGKQPADIETETNPWQAAASLWALGTGFLLSMVLVLTVLFA